jgi:fibronectin type 3 domain-containing protein
VEIKNSTQRPQRNNKVCTGDFVAMKSLFRIITLCFLLAFSSGIAFDGPLRLAWDPPPNYWIVGYHVYRSDISGGPYTRLTEDPVPGCEYSDETAVPGKQYFYVVTTVGTDGEKSAFSSELAVTLANYDATPEPGALIVRADADLKVQEGDMVLLAGNYRDPEGKNVTYKWSQVSGAITVSISGSDQAEASFLAPMVSTETVLIFALTVTDAEGGSTTDTIRVTVRPASW